MKKEDIIANLLEIASKKESTQPKAKEDAAKAKAETAKVKAEVEKVTTNPPRQKLKDVVAKQVSEHGVHEGAESK